MSRRHHSPLILPEIDHAACTPALRRRLLQENPLFADLPEESVDRINQRFSDRGFEQGAGIIREGAPAKRLYIVALGVVKLFRLTESGEPSLVDILTSGEYFGSLTGFGPASYEESAEAASTVCALSVDTETFRNIVSDHPSVAIRAMDALSNRLRLAHEMSTRRRGQEASARIGAILLRLAEKLGHPWEGNTLIRSPLSREEIASMAATTPETCSRILSSFRKNGVIESGRGWIAVRDTNQLAETAGISTE